MTLPIVQDQEGTLLSNLLWAIENILTQFNTQPSVQRPDQFTKEISIGPLVVKVAGDNTSRMMSVQQDEAALMTLAIDDANAFPWSSVETRIADSGALTSRTTIKDNGLIQEDFYDNGQRVAKRLTDAEGDHAWATITNYYDETGRTSKVTQFDNGVQREDFFDDGVRYKTIQTDVDDGAGGAKSWVTVTSEYDGGVITNRTVVYDDGITRSEVFLNGVRAQVTQTDGTEDVKDWQHIVTYYDALGVVTSRETLYDNNVLRNDFFEDGQLQVVTQVDPDDDETGQSAFPWSDIIQFYAPDGSLVSRGTTNDDGVIRIEDFNAGLRSKIIDEDRGHLHDWDSIERIYAAGQIQSKQTTYDNGDISVMLYENTQRAGRIDHDVDMSETWTYRLTTYNDTGVDQVTTFDSLDLVPDEYAGYLQDTFVM